MEVVVHEMEESGIEEKINLMITQSEQIREISKKKVNLKQKYLSNCEIND